MCPCDSRLFLLFVFFLGAARGRKFQACLQPIGRSGLSLLLPRECDAFAREPWLTWFQKACNTLHVLLGLNGMYHRKDVFFFKRLTLWRQIINLMRGELRVRQRAPKVPVNSLTLAWDPGPTLNIDPGSRTRLMLTDHFWREHGPTGWFINPGSILHQ